MYESSWGTLVLAFSKRLDAFNTHIDLVWSLLFSVRLAQCTAVRFYVSHSCAFMCPGAVRIVLALDFIHVKIRRSD
jgi:hypothetical protein